MANIDDTRRAHPATGQDEAHGTARDSDHPANAARAHYFAEAEDQG